MASQIVGTAAYPQKPTNNQDYICGSIVLAVGWRLRFCFLAEPQKRGVAREPRWVRCQPPTGLLRVRFEPSTNADPQTATVRIGVAEFAPVEHFGPVVC